VPITSKVVSLNPVHGEVYSMQHYVMKFVSDRSLVFSGYFGFPTTIRSRPTMAAIPGADPGFQVMGGVQTLKNCAERREVRNFVWVFHVKNHDFTL
jgi:hypothetical protein